MSLKDRMNSTENVTLTPCATCARRSANWTLTCEAFKSGIPEVILNGDNQHREPYPGDHGLQYVPRTRA